MPKANAITRSDRPVNTGASSVLSAPLCPMESVKLTQTCALLPVVFPFTDVRDRCDPALVVAAESTCCPLNTISARANCYSAYVDSYTELTRCSPSAGYEWMPSITLVSASKFPIEKKKKNLRALRRTQKKKKK